MTGFNIKKENTNLEVLIKVMNSLAGKYDCSIKADFKNGKRRVLFKGDEVLKPYIVAEMADMFPNLAG